MNMNEPDEPALVNMNEPALVNMNDLEVNVDGSGEKCGAGCYWH